MLLQVSVGYLIMTEESLNLICCTKHDMDESFIFIYDDYNHLIHHLIQLGHDSSCRLNWAEIEEMMKKAKALEESTL